MAAIVGIGHTDYTSKSGRSTLALAAEACQLAVEDAGLTLDTIDGIGTFHLNDSTSTGAVATATGVPQLTWTLDWLAGGNAPAALIGQAAAAIDRGEANAIVCFRSMNGRSGRRLGGSGFEPAAGGAAQYYQPMGLSSYPQRMAMWCRRHMIKHGTTQEQLGAVAMSARDYASKNERAMQRTPLTMDDYLDSRWIVEPLRLLDICLESDGACAVVVASDAVAQGCRPSPISILSAASFAGSGPGLDLGDLLTWDDLTTNYCRGLAPRLFGQAGVTPEDVDVAEIYDCFTFTVLLTLESLGFFDPGDAGEYFENGGGQLGSPLPVNTNGGLLSEAYIHGMNTVYEAVEQLRGDAGPRQVQGAKVALVTSGAWTIGSGLILGRQ